MIVSSRATPVSASAENMAPILTGGARVEVCIAGCGLAGMIAAYLLAREKRSVMVVDDGPIGGLQVGAEMAQPARVAAQSFAVAIDSIEAIVRRERIACEFERLDGYCLASPRDAPKEVERLNAPPIEGAVAVPCVRYPGQALLHPGKLAAGLARAIGHSGGRIHCGVRTRGIEVGRETSLLTSAGHRIQADIVITPGASPAQRRVPPGMLAYVIGLRVPRGAITRALYWDVAGQRCARLRAQGMRAADVLLAAGRGSEAEDAAQYDALEAWARRHFPCAGDVVQRFSGETLRTADMFAFAGRDVADTESVYVSDAGWGTAMTRAVIAGMAIRDFVEGTRAPSGEPSMPSASYTSPGPPAHARELVQPP